MAETRDRRLYFLSILFAAAPFVFGLIRASRAHDLRMLWMAFASLLGAALVTVIGKRYSRESKVFVVSIVILVIATLLAGSAALLLGATAAAGIWPVAFVFGVCWATSYWLATFDLFFEEVR